MEQAGQFAAVLVVLITLAAALWVLNRRGLVQWRPLGTGPRQMQVIERLPLTAQHSLHLVKVGDSMLIVASAPGGCSVLGPVPSVGERA
ncbi:MAG TPA: flagellar biosynthetic protein FliO [Bryobacteraceae bacterium]|nr:flagellar biosynthetic protein FliO [Bryobacteraceae bacterium]